MDYKFYGQWQNSLGHQKSTNNLEQLTNDSGDDIDYNCSHFLFAKRRRQHFAIFLLVNRYCWIFCRSETSNDCSVNREGRSFVSFSTVKVYIYLAYYLLISMQYEDQKSTLFGQLSLRGKINLGIYALLTGITFINITIIITFIIFLTLCYSTSYKNTYQMTMEWKYTYCNFSWMLLVCQ